MNNNVEGSCKPLFMESKKIVVAITGASGSPYSIKLIDTLIHMGYEVHIVASKNGKAVFEHENGISFTKYIQEKKEIFPTKVFEHDNDNLFSSIASGSFKIDGMAIVPCSMSSLGNIANGTSGTLIGRAADVCLKEKRRLVLLVRETPLNSIHLTNMLTLSNMGAFIVPAVPAFYNMPKTIDDIINFVNGRVLDCLGVDNDLYPRWS